MKDNKLLAEYLGLELAPSMTPMVTYREDKYTTKYFEPEGNWNDLMMVVEKIEKESKAFYFELWYQTVPQNGRKIAWWCALLDYDFNIQHGKTMIEAVYNACVEYIKSKP